MSLTGEGDVIARAGSPSRTSRPASSCSRGARGVAERGRTGAGARLRLSLFAAMAEWMHQPMLYAAGTGAAGPRSARTRPSIAPYGPVACADGAVHLAVQTTGSGSACAA